MNNDFFSHSWGDLPMIFTCDFVTRENHWQITSLLTKLEQLERLRSEDTPRRLMITHTIESYWIPNQKKTKSKLQI